jgi:hypothetical protein
MHLLAVPTTMSGGKAQQPSLCSLNSLLRLPASSPTAITQDTEAPMTRHLIWNLRSLDLQTLMTEIIVPLILGFAKYKLIRNIAIELHSLLGRDTAFQARGSSVDTSGSYCAGGLNASTSSERSSNLKRKRNDERDSNSQPPEDDRNNRPSTP